MKRVNLIEQQADQSSGSSEWDHDNIVLYVNGVGAKQFVLKGKINKQQFTTMIDSETSELTRFLTTDLLYAGSLSKNEEEVDYNRRQLNLKGYNIVDMEVGKQKMKAANIMIKRDGKELLIGWDWLTKLN